MINISIEFDWEAAKLDVTDRVLDPVIGKTLRYKNEDGEAAISYLPTQYFDQTGLRFYELEDQAANHPNIAQDTMRNLMTVWLAQKEVYDEATANNAFGLWREGNHDTRMAPFSWNCRGCGESIKAPYDLDSIHKWQNKVVVITEQEEILSGEYDGYGRVGWEEINSDAPECWHQECYEVHGEPKRYTGPSEYAYDQGYFYDRGN